MKSKQINFFIAPDDKSEISTFLKANDCLLVRTNVKDALIDSGASLEQKDTFQIFLSKEDFRNEVFFEQVDGKNYYYVDVIRSLVIEFDIGGFYPYSNKELHRGRFYCVTSFYKNEKIVEKDQQFVKWMNEIFKQFKRDFLCKKNEYMGYYFSINAIKWANQNNAKLDKSGLKLIADK